MLVAHSCEFVERKNGSIHDGWPAGHPHICPRCSPGHSPDYDQRGHYALCVQCELDDAEAVAGCPQWVPDAMVVGLCLTCGRIHDPRTAYTQEGDRS